MDYHLNPAVWADLHTWLLWNWTEFYIWDIQPITVFTGGEKTYRCLTGLFKLNQLKEHKAEPFFLDAWTDYQ